MKQNLLKNFKRIWTLSSIRRMSLIRFGMYQYGQYVGYRNIFSRGQKYFLARYKNGIARTYLDKIETNEQMKLIKKKFFNEQFVRNDLLRLAKKMEKDFDSSIKKIKMLPQDFSKKNNSTLLKYLKQFKKIDNSMSIYYWILFNDIEKTLIESLSNLMKKRGYSHDEIQADLRILAEPSLIIPVDLERLSLLKIALMKGKKQEKALIKHYREFAFLPMYEIDFNEYPLKHFRAELKKITRKHSSDEIKKKIKLMENKYQNRKIKGDRVLKKYGLEKAIFGLAKFVVTFVNFKDRKPYVRDQISYWGKNLFLEISKRSGLSLTQTLFLSDYELVGIIKGDLNISKEKIDGRIKDSAIFFNGLKQTIFADKKRLECIDKIIAIKETAKTISGFSASPGKVKGEACIILSNTDLFKFKRGQILVSGSTRPDFLPIMKKAAAIVTNEGGMLSHAAIVARELKKPCIIGTKIATQVLKDGDLVEVDANRGIVKILKKAE